MLSEVSHYNFVNIYIVTCGGTFMYAFQRRQDRERERITEREVMTEIVCLYISVLFGIIMIMPNN